MTDSWFSWQKHTLLPHILGGVVALLLGVLVTELMIGLLADSQIERQRSETTDKLATLRARLEGEINSTLYLTRGLIAYVATEPEVGESEFNALTSEIVSSGKHIRNIGLARNNIISHMYPLAGNEAALGLEYEKVPGQWPAVKRAIDLKGTVLAGPVNLVQGGTAFIARTPIYTRSGVSGILQKQRPVYWGIASIAIDMSSLFGQAGIEQEVDGLQLAVRGKDGMGEKGDLILGNEQLFRDDAIMQSIMFPNGSWQIAAIPVGGWHVAPETLLLPRLAGWFAAAVVGMLLSVLLWTRAANRRLALHDHLTGLPNRRLLEDRMQQMIVRNRRDRLSFGILFVDLDDFKAVNDDFGHKIGDALLIEVGRRMQASVRGMDTVARMGGDEFIVLVDQVTSEADLRRIHGDLKNSLIGTLYVEGHQITLSASIGRAVFPRDGNTVDDLLKMGDREMYVAKKRSRIQAVKQPT